MAEELGFYDEAMKYYDIAHWYTWGAKLAEKLGLKEKAKKFHKKEVKKLAQYDWYYDEYDYSHAGYYAQEHELYDEAIEMFELGCDYGALSKLYKKLGDEEKTRYYFEKYLLYSKYVPSNIQLAKDLGYEEDLKKLYKDELLNTEKQEQYLEAIEYAIQLNLDDKKEELFEKFIKASTEKQKENPEYEIEHIDILKYINLPLDRVITLHENRMNYFDNNYKYQEASNVARDLGLIDKQVDYLMKANNYDEALTIAEKHNLDEIKFEIYEKTKSNTEILDLAKELNLTDKVEFYESLINSF